MSRVLSQRIGRAFFGTLGELREAQEKAVPVILDGRDILVVAGTGSGKTEAVIAPLVERYLAGLVNVEGPVILYVAPTRALVNDLRQRLDGPLSRLGLVVGARHGERNDLAKVERPQLLVTTLESYDSVLTTRPETFDDVRAVVVDEVHQLAGTQRGLQLRHVIARHEHRLKRPLQLAAMSATVDDPMAVWNRLRPEAELGHDVELVAAQEQRTRQYVLARASDANELRFLLDRTYTAGKVLAFAGSRRRCEEVASTATGGAYGDRVMVHHSSLAAAERLLVEDEFRKPDPALVLATSTLELGIDVGDVGLVALIGPPADWRSFAQRLGRANRRGTEVKVLCVVPPWSTSPVRECAAFLALIDQLESADHVGSATGMLIGATGQQVVNQLRQKGTPTWQSVPELQAALGLASSVPIVAVLEELLEHDIVLRHPIRASQWAAGPGIGTLERSGDLWGNFPVGSQVLKILNAGRILGDVPATNGVQLDVGATFVLRGHTWRVERRARGEVHVRPHAGPAGVALSFGGTAMVLDPSVLARLPTAVRAPTPSKVRMSTSTAQWWIAVREHLGGSLLAGTLPCWRHEGRWVTATWAGRTLNRAALRLLGSAGEADDTVLRTDERPDLQALPGRLDGWIEDVGAVVEVPGELTTWQQRLPVALLKQELIEQILTYPETQRAIDRMTTWRVAPCADDRLEALCPLR